MRERLDDEIATRPDESLHAIAAAMVAWRRDPNHWLIESLHQVPDARSGRGWRSELDLMAYRYLMDWISRGAVMVAPIAVSAWAQPESVWQENSNTLEALDFLDAYIDKPSTHGRDGWLNMRQPIPFQIIGPGDGRGVIQHRIKSSVGIEVGQIAMSKSVVGLMMDRHLARLPYPIPGMQPTLFIYTTPGLEACREQAGDLIRHIWSRQSQ